MMVVMNQDDVDLFLERSNDRCWATVSQKKGHYFSDKGDISDMGPWGRGDFRFPPPSPLSIILFYVPLFQEIGYEW